MIHIIYECGFTKNSWGYKPYTKQYKCFNENAVNYLTDPWRNDNKRYFKTEREARKWYREAKKNADDMSYGRFCDYYGLCL